MKSRVLGALLILTLITSCKKLKVEYFDLISDCKPTGINWADTLRQPENGIHYVAVDTSTCRLIVKYDEDKTTIGWINDYLKRNNLDFIPIEIDEDTLSIEIDSIQELEVEVLEVAPPQSNLDSESTNEIVEQDLIEELNEEVEEASPPSAGETQSTDTSSKIIEDTL